jgi:hypothetical protein
MSARDCHGLNAVVKQLQLPDPNKLEPRPDGCAPHPCLAAKLGVACVRCTYRFNSLELAQRHLAKIHVTKGGRKSWLRDHHRNNPLLQSWSQNGSGYWIVAVNQENSLGAVRDEPSDALETSITNESDAYTDRLKDSEDDGGLIRWMHRACITYGLYRQCMRGASKRLLDMQRQGYPRKRKVGQQWHRLLNSLAFSLLKNTRVPNL